MMLPMNDTPIITVSEKRGQIGMDECNVLPYFKGIAIHDYWKSYWKYSDIQLPGGNGTFLLNIPPNKDERFVFFSYQ